MWPLTCDLEALVDNFNYSFSHFSFHPRCVWALLYFSLMELSCSWRSRGSPCRWLRGSWDKRCGFTCWGLFSMCSCWVCWAEPSTSSILRSVLLSLRWVSEFAYLTKVFLSFNISFTGPGSVSFRETTTGWSVWLLSTSPPSPSPLSIWSCLTYSVRSHRLKTTPSPCRSMLRCWGKIHGYKVKSSTNVCHLRWVSFRSIFLKLASLGIYLFFIFTPDDPSVSQEFSVWWGAKLGCTQACRSWSAACSVQGEKFG